MKSSREGPGEVSETNTSARQPWLRERLLSGTLAVILTLLAAKFVFNLTHFPGGFMVFGIPALANGTAAILCWWFALRGQRSDSRAVLRIGCLTGLACGGLGFFIGFAGPLIVAPDAQQGPLLGFFVTGPLGFGAGAVCGVIFAILRQRMQ